MLKNVLLPAFILAFAMPVFGATFAGQYHNDREGRRATLETSNGIYLLDFQGVNIYAVGERYDRDNAQVTGTLSYNAGGGYPILVVDRITFHPYGNAVSYNIRSQYYPRNRNRYTYVPRYERWYYNRYPSYPTRYRRYDRAYRFR